MSHLRHIAVLMIFGGGCIPTRDNLQDPQNRPVAILNALTVEGGRATPFELDATASYDPRAAGAPLHFAWELDDPALDADVGEEELDDFNDVPGDSGHIFQNFPKAFLASSNGNGIVVRRVRVRVSSDDGASSVAEATIVVRNERPIVDPGEDLFLSTTRSEAVVLDARGGGSDPTSVDPDGDPLFFTWTQLTGDPVVLDTSMDPVHKQRVGFVPPLAKRSLTFRVDGSDGMSQETGFLRVHRAKQVWIASRAPTRVYRVFPDFRSKTSLEDLSAPATPVEFTAIGVVAVTPGGNVWTAERAVNDTLVRRLDPELRQIATFVIAGWALPTWSDAEGEDLCLVVQRGTVPVGDRAFVRVGPAGLVAAPVAAPDAIQTHATGTGDCWAVSASKIDRFDAAANLTTIVSGFDRLSRSTVAEDGQLWASVVDPLGFVDRILRVSTTGVPEDVYLYPVPPPGTQYLSLTDLAPRRGGGVWVHDSNRSLMTLSPSGILASTDAPRMRLDPSLPRRQFVSDLSDGTLWLADSQSGDLIHLFDAGDTIRELGRTAIESLAPSAPLFLTPYVTADGSVIATATGNGESWIFRIPTHLNSSERVDASLVSTFLMSLSVDRGRGAAWIADGATFEQRLLRVSHTGRVLVKRTDSTSRVIAQADGSAWALVFDAGTSATRVEQVSSTGGLLTTVPVSGLGQFLAIDASGEDGCAIASADPNLFPFDTTTFGVRYSSASPQPEVLQTQAAGPEGISSCWIDRVDGATWFVTASQTCFMNSPGTSTLRRFAPGSTTPSLTLTSAQGVAFACNFAGDDAGGVWMAQAGTMSRIGAAGPTGETVTGVGTVVPCGNGDPACREVWSRANVFEVVRADSAGKVLDRFRPPTSGQITTFDVIP